MNATKTSVCRLVKQNDKYRNMRNCFVAIFVASALTTSIVLIRQKAQAQNTSPQPTDKTGATIADAVGAKTNNQESSPIFVTNILPGYGDWRLISVAHEEGNLNAIRAILGNDLAIKASGEKTLPLPDGTIIARLAWSYVPLEENNKIFGRPQSFVAGPPTNGIQFMVKDSKKYAATGGWDSLISMTANLPTRRSCKIAFSATRRSNLEGTKLTKGDFSYEYNG